jgi:hypothetical protein
MASAQRCRTVSYGPRINYLNGIHQTNPVTCGVAATPRLESFERIVRDRASIFENCAGRVHQIALLCPVCVVWEAGAMQLSQMWREHLQAGCPPEMRGLSIAGTAARELDAEITACVSASLTHSLKMDSRIERRLHDIAYALEHVEPASPEVAAYCSRLNKLVSAVLVSAGPLESSSDSDTARTAVRPGVRRR